MVLSDKILGLPLPNLLFFGFGWCLDNHSIQICRKAGALLMAEAQGMVQKTGAHLWITHVLMITGVLVIFFPIWLAFVASTVTQPEIVSPPMPILPGDHFWENYKAALFSGVNVPVATMLINSLLMAIGIAIGKIIISLLSAFAIVYFRFPGRTFFFLFS